MLKAKGTGRTIGGQRGDIVLRDQGGTIGGQSPGVFNPVGVNPRDVPVRPSTALSPVPGPQTGGSSMTEIIPAIERPPADHLLPTELVAKRYDVRPATIGKWSRRGVLPKPVGFDLATKERLWDATTLPSADEIE